MADRVIIDASVAAKWFFPEEDSQRALSVRERGAFLIAPEIILAELATPVWKYLRRGAITPETARLVCVDFEAVFNELIPIRTLAPRASEIMIDLAHPIYDCLYLALAERERAPLVTADERLLKAARQLGTVKALHLADL